MLARLLNAFTPQEINKNRLAAINYTGEIPEPFLDPMYAVIMDNPIILDNTESQTLDECSLYKKGKSSINTFTNMPIETKTPHVKLKQAIEQFVSSLEKIHSLKNLLQKLEEPIDMDALLDNTDALPKDYDVFLSEQEQQQNQAIMEVKTLLLDTLENFIRETTFIIENQEKLERQITQEKNEILGPQIELLEYYKKVFFLPKIEPEVGFDAVGISGMPSSRRPYQSLLLSSVQASYPFQYGLLVKNGVFQQTPAMPEEQKEMEDIINTQTLRIRTSNSK